MTKYKILTTILIIALLGLSASAFAGDINKNAGTSAFPFLKINLGARAVGMGGAFTGLANDESALYFNPAGIALLTENRFMVDYHNYFVDIQSGFVGYIRKLNEKHTLGIHIDYLNYGTFIRTDNLGTATGEFSGSDLLLAGTIARRHTEKLSFGATIKIIYERLEEFSSTGLAFDIGVRTNSDRGYRSAGLMVQNLGFQLSALGDEKYKLPLTIRGGGAIQPKGLSLILTGDIIVPIDNDIDFALGGEYINFKPLYLRLGWNSFGSNYRAIDSDDNWAGLSFGAGFDVKEKYKLSYSYTPGADLGESHRVTLSGGI